MAIFSMRKAEIDSGINILSFLQNKTHRDILTRGFENAVRFSGGSCSKNVEISKRLQLQLKKKKKRAISTPLCCQLRELAWG